RPAHPAQQLSNQEVEIEASQSGIRDRLELPELPGNMLRLHPPGAFLFELRSTLTLHLAPAADVAKHQDDSRHRSVRGPDGSGAVVHWNLAAVFRDQHGVIGQAGDDILAHDLAD